MHHVIHDDRDGLLVDAQVTEPQQKMQRDGRDDCDGILYTTMFVAAVAFVDNSNSQDDTFPDRIHAIGCIRVKTSV